MNLKCNIYLFICALTLCFANTSCSKYSLVDCETYDYSDCITQAPGIGELEVNVNFPDGQTRIPIVILRGQYPSQDTILLDTLERPSWKYSFPVSYDYSVVAEYYRDGQKISAVDGDDIRQKSYNVCDSVCWEVKDAKVNVALKFD